jgi:hypothetical protein
MWGCGRVNATIACCRAALLTLPKSCPWPARPEQLLEMAAANRRWPLNVGYRRRLSVAFC